MRAKCEQRENIVLCLEDTNDWSNATTRRLVMQVGGHAFDNEMHNFQKNDRQAECITVLLPPRRLTPPCPGLS